MKSQETKFQDQHDLSQEQDLSNESRPKNHRDEQQTLKLSHNMNRNDDNRQEHFKQKTSDHNGQNSNHIEKDLKLNLTKQSEHQSQNRNLNEDSQSNEVDEQKSDYSAKLNQDQRHKGRVSEHDSYNKEHLDKDSTSNEVEDQKDTNTTTISSLKSSQKTSEHHSHLNKKRQNVYKHTMVTDNDFTYMVAVLKGTTYLCGGALIDERWVLTAASEIRL